LPLLVLLIFFLVKYVQTEPIQRLMDRMKLRLWIIGPLFKRLSIARFARALGSLSNSGVPILQALEVISGTMGNYMMENVVKEALSDLREGEPITEALRKS